MINYKTNILKKSDGIETSAWRDIQAGHTYNNLVWLFETFVHSVDKGINYHPHTLGRYWEAMKSVKSGLDNFVRSLQFL